MAAQGTVVVFNEAMQWFGSDEMDLENGSFKLMLITNALVPLQDKAIPNISDYTEISASTNYVAGGADLAVTYNRVTNVVTFDSTTNPGWVKDAAGSPSIFYGLVYDSADGNCLAFVVLATNSEATPISLAAGDVSVTWNVAGVFKLTQV